METLAIIEFSVQSVMLLLYKIKTDEDYLHCYRNEDYTESAPNKQKVYKKSSFKYKKNINMCDDQKFLM